jgi:hypothetical protein
VGKLAASLIRRFPSIQMLTQIKVAHVDQRQVRCEVPKIGSCPNKTALEGAHVRRRSGGRPREAVLSVWRVSRARKCIIRRYSRARAALGDQALGVIRILDVLVAAIAAQMMGNELVVEVDADPIRICLDRQSAVSVCGRDGILIGIRGDAELAGGDTGRGVCEVVGVRVERPQMSTKRWVAKHHDHVSQATMSCWHGSTPGSGFDIRTFECPLLRSRSSARGRACRPDEISGNSGLATGELRAST